TTWRQLSRIALALLVITGRVTMLGLSRWAGKGGSYRTVQRLFSTGIPWAILFWVFFRQHVYCPDDVSLAAGDEVVVTKAGKNTHKAPLPLTPELVRIKAMLEALLRLITTVLAVTSLVLDGHFGNHNALHMVRQCNLHLIATLRCDAALDFPYTGPYAGRGPRRKYGRKVDYDNLPETYRKHTTVDGHIETRLSQPQLLHKAPTQPVHAAISAQP